ncbi:MAG TPA: ATP-grasp domain-containing protein [Candidatus Moranbacteria bacterium]|nr:ATP-grasp domain-containing protein [Candidatus Moranbacteria bacterium]
MKELLVLILYDKSNKNAEDFPSAYKDLYAYLKNKNVILCRAKIASFDKKTGFFKKAQFYNKNWFFRKNVRPDLVYDKSPFITDKNLMVLRKLIARCYPFCNSLNLSKLLSDKWLTYKAFSDFSPKAVLVTSKSDLGKIKQLSSQKIILKPLGGSGGKGIKIFEKSAMKPVLYPFLAQELIEVKKGIKGFASGAHDLRIMIRNEKIFYSFLRIPQKNKLLSNLSQGGTVRVVPIDKLPKLVFPFIKKIQSKLKKYKIKLYSIDIIIDDNKKPWIIEMNSRPGITLEKEELPYREYFYNNLIIFFKKAL